jgi:hypothetical protein
MQTVALFVQYNEVNLWTVSSRMKTTPAHDLKCHELGPSVSTVVSVVKHRDPFQLICLFCTSILKFIGSIHCQRRHDDAMNGSSRVARGQRTEEQLNTAQPTVFQSVIRGEKDRNAVPVVKKRTGTAFR